MKKLELNNRIFFYALLVFVFLLAYLLLKPYISLIIVSMIVVVMYKPVYEWALQKFKGKVGSATTFSIFTVIITILVPLILILNLLIFQLAGVIGDIRQFVSGKGVTIETLIEESNNVLEKLPGINYQIDQDQIRELLASTVEPGSAYLLSQSVAITTASIETITNIVVFIILLAGLFPNINKLSNYIKKLSPLDEKIDNLYISRVSLLTKSVIKGGFVVAIVQGVLSGFSYWIGGADYVFLWGLLATIFSLVPPGSGFISIPLGLALILLGNVWGGLMIILVNIFVVSLIDNILRPKLISKDAQIHHALLAIGFLGGIRMFGFWGLIYGPVILILLTTTLEVYDKHYRLKGTN